MHGNRQTLFFNLLLQADIFIYRAAKHDSETPWVHFATLQSEDCYFHLQLFIFALFSDQHRTEQVSVTNNMTLITSDTSI